MSSFGARIASTIAAFAGFTYGFLHLIAAFIYSVQQKEYWSDSSEEEKAQLSKVSHEFWSLERSFTILTHNFITLPNNGSQLHYLSHRTSSENDLVICLHGFPDTAYLFSRYVTFPPAISATFVALDLPGCGGSDDLDDYSAEAMLNCIGAAIVELKSRYLGEEKKCVLVGHDWGGVIAFRLAAETKGLVDRVVVLNSLYPAHAAAMFKQRVSRGVQHLSSLRFEDAREALGPVLSQIRKSGYTFMLTLPIPIARYMPRVARCLIKFVHSLEYKQTRKYDKELTQYLRASKLSAACGPGPIESRSSSSTGQSYGPSVFARALKNPPGDWDQRVRIYGEGLLRGKWTPSFPEYESQKHDVVSTGKFQCPIDVIFGLKDVALDPRIALDGIEKFFQDGANGRVTRLPDCGHWWIHDKTGAGPEAMSEVLNRVLEGEE